MSEQDSQSRIYDTGLERSALQKRFQAGEFPVAVYGLGKMGLPLAGVFGEVSENVVGADIDPEVVESVNSGHSHVTGEPGLDELVEELVAEESLSATVSPKEAAAASNIHVVIVPTLITEDNEPDLSILDAVIEEVAYGLSPGDLVIIESTVPPQTTEQRVWPTLIEESGLSKGEFGLAFCPERTSSGRALQDIRGAYPKIVGGVDVGSTEAAKAVYEAINDKGVITVSDATTAEAVKVFEGLYRDVNIALANELATYTDELGIDVREAIDVANTQPFCDIHDPGPGVGGHCIPIYPYFMIKQFQTDAPMLKTAREVNDSMPQYTVRKLQEQLEVDGISLDESKVLILGVAYRNDVAEMRNSPATDIIEYLTTDGADVFVVDPLIDDLGDLQVTQLPMAEIYSQEFDAVVFVTAHSDFRDIDWNQVESRGDQLIVIDGRQALDSDEIPHQVYTIGSGYHV